MQSCFTAAHRAGLVARPQRGASRAQAHPAHVPARAKSGVAKAPAREPALPSVMKAGRWSTRVHGGGFGSAQTTQADTTEGDEDGVITVSVTEAQIKSLDLGPAREALAVGSEGWADRLLTRTVDFRVEFEQEETDPRELCELPEVRLWFLRLDAECPWLPVVLDWTGGELARYAAMLLPHQVSKAEGIVYNPEALELFISHRLFMCYDWLKSVGVKEPENRIKDMSKMFGFTMDNSIFFLIKSKP